MQNKVTQYLLVALSSLFSLVGCGGQAYLPSIVSNAPELTAVAQQQQPEPMSKDFVLIWEVFGTPTPRPTLNFRDSATATAYAQNRQSGNSRVVEQPQAANVPAGELLPGDPRRGEMVFMGAGTCMTCHDTTSGITVVGPTLKGVSHHAEEHAQGKSVDEYLHESILNPDAYVVPGFNPVMPKHFGTALTPQQIEDLIAYLKSLK
jgi:cytochrome c2